MLAQTVYAEMLIYLFCVQYSHFNNKKNSPHEQKNKKLPDNVTLERKIRMR